jgi:KaiC/GvpD/RAD55 family RecA-like ATPase
LRRLQVTTVFAAETLEPFSRDLHLIVHRLSAVTQNVIFLRQHQVGGALQRELSVLKTRDRAHDLRPTRFDISGQGIIVVGPVEPENRKKMLRSPPARPKKGRRRR